MDRGRPCLRMDDACTRNGNGGDVRGDYGGGDDDYAGGTTAGACGGGIPRIVHKVWFDLGNGPRPPARFDAMYRTLLRHHPGWTVLTWDEAAAERLLRERYAWFLPTWRAYRDPVYRVDAIRLFALHAHGGVYVDQDIEHLRSMAPMLAGPDPRRRPRRNVLVRSRNWRRGVSNFAMACERGSRFFTHAVRRLPAAARLPWNVRGTCLGTMYVAGPGFLQRCVRRYDRPWEVTVLGERAFQVPDRALPGGGGFDDAYGVHAYCASWGFSRKLLADVMRGLVAVMLLALAALAVAAALRRPSRRCAR